MFPTENIIQKLRKEQNLTQADLAKMLGVSRQTVNSLETGRYNPTLGLAHSIAVVFGKTIEEIFIFEERK